MKKGRWPKDPVKIAKLREELRVATEYKKALNRRKYGTLGAASKVRHIDPTTYQTEIDSESGERSR